MIFRKEFKVGQKVLMFNTRMKLFPSKLRSRWVGPFIVTNVFSHSVVEVPSKIIGIVSKVNGQCLKPFYESFKEHDVEELNLGEPVALQRWNSSIQL